MIELAVMIVAIFFCFGVFIAACWLVFAALGAVFGLVGMLIGLVLQAIPYMLGLATVCFVLFLALEILSK